jgi:hypothetical protein
VGWWSKHLSTDNLQVAWTMWLLWHTDTLDGDDIFQAVKLRIIATSRGQPQEKTATTCKHLSSKTVGAYKYHLNFYNTYVYCTKLLKYQYLWPNYCECLLIVSGLAQPLDVIMTHNLVNGDSTACLNFTITRQTIGNIKTRYILQKFRIVKWIGSFHILRIKWPGISVS